MLSNKLAQKIVERVMENIPYNINIMNENGIIIGSGESSRIGQVHKGALEVVRTKKDVEIIKDTLEEKKGVNIPIIFRNRTIGVIGITGDPHIVRPFAKLVSITAELLVNQEYTLNESIIEQKLVEEFLYQWINTSDDYDQAFIQKSISLGINVTSPKQIIVIQSKKVYYKSIKDVVNKVINEEEHILDMVNDIIIVIMDYDNDIDKRIIELIDRLKVFNVKVGIGKHCEKVAISFKQALKALDIGNKLYENVNVYRYEDIQFFDEINNGIKKNTYRDIIADILDEGGDELLKTFIRYIELNGERLKIAKDLHIHRNTLNYRIEKIQEITKLNINEYKDLIKLITAYIDYKISK